VTIERRYKDEPGNWRSATSFRTADLPKLLFALTCSRRSPQSVNTRRSELMMSCKNMFSITVLLRMPGLDMI